jgi:hypothetical protein
VYTGRYRRLDYLTVEDGSKGCPETSGNYLSRVPSKKISFAQRRRKPETTQIRRGVSVVSKGTFRVPYSNRTDKMRKHLTQRAIS